MATTSDHPAGSAQQENNYLHLASKSLSFSDATESTILGQTIKNMEIGGVVFDWGAEFPAAIDAGDVEDDGDTTPLENMMAWYQVGLLYDRMFFDTGGGSWFPSSVGDWEPFFSDWPIAATVTPDVSNLQSSRPTRILWRKTFTQAFGVAAVVQNAGGGALYVPNRQPVVTRGGTINKRLRLRLDEDFGLFHYVTCLNEGSFSVDARARFRTIWFAGTLYYAVS